MGISTTMTKEELLVQLRAWKEDRLAAIDRRWETYRTDLIAHLVACSEEAQANASEISGLSLDAFRDHMNIRDRKGRYDYMPSAPRMPYCHVKFNTLIEQVAASTKTKYTIPADQWDLWAGWAKGEDL